MGLVLTFSYLLGLLAMIKCSICSYQCDNWYVSNWRLACHIYFWLGRCPPELAWWLSRVALALHKVGSSTPLGVTIECDVAQDAVAIWLLLEEQSYLKSLKLHTSTWKYNFETDVFFQFDIGCRKTCLLFFLFVFWNWICYVGSRVSFCRMYVEFIICSEKRGVATIVATLSSC